jgi:hypothetical protein
MVYSSLFYVPRRNIVSVVELSYTFSVPCKDNHKLSKIVDLVTMMFDYRLSGKALILWQSIAWAILIMVLRM